MKNDYLYDYPICSKNNNGMYVTTILPKKTSVNLFIKKILVCLYQIIIEFFRIQRIQNLK